MLVHSPFQFPKVEKEHFTARNRGEKINFVPYFNEIGLIFHKIFHKITDNHILPEDIHDVVVLMKLPFDVSLEEVLNVSSDFGLVGGDEREESVVVTLTKRQQYTVLDETAKF